MFQASRLSTRMCFVSAASAPHAALAAAPRARRAAAVRATRGAACMMHGRRRVRVLRVVSLRRLLARIRSLSQQVVVLTLGGLVCAAEAKSR